MAEEKLDFDYKKGFNLGYALIREGGQHQYFEILEKYRGLKEHKFDQLWLGLEAGKRQALIEKPENEINTLAKEAAIVVKKNPLQNNLKGENLNSAGDNPLSNKGLAWAADQEKDNIYEGRGNLKSDLKGSSEKGESEGIIFTKKTSMKDDSGNIRNNQNGEKDRTG